MRPITPQPGHTEGEVTAAMQSGQFVYMDCFTIIPLVGDPLRYTTAQQDTSVVSLGGIVRHIYEARTVLIRGLRVKNNLGVEVDEQEVEMDYTANPTYQGALSWAQALLQGRLDGASIRRDRYIATTWGNGPAGDTDWLGGFPMFLGLVSALNMVGRQTATVNVKSDLILLNRQAPAFLWEPNCKNTWGDAGCGVVQSDWAVDGVIGASSSNTVIKWVDSSVDYNLGKIHISNGDDVTRVRTVARATSTELLLAYPLDFLPTPGAHFTAYPGCSRTSDDSHGCPKYWGDDWRDHFKGMPFIPVAETGI